MSYKNLHKLQNIDILVIGGGSAGATAAITAAAHSQNSVMLVERYGFLGGSSTQMLDTFYGFFTPGDSSKKIVGGMPDMVVNSLNSFGEVFLRPNTYGAGTGVNYNPERLKHVWDILCAQYSVKVLLHTILIDVQKASNNQFEAIFWNKSGFFSITAQRIIDASGDADFCHHAGFEYELAGTLEPAQSMTNTFRMANVNIEKYEAAGGKKMLQEFMAKTKHPLPRREGSVHAMNIYGCVSTVAVKVSGYNAVDTQQLSLAEVEGRNQSYVFEKFFRAEVPGYENAKIIGLSTQIGVRETRRVYGNNRLTKDDCMAAQIPKDSILLCGAPIEDHRQGPNGTSETVWGYIPGTGIYGVPYGTIVPQNSENVWVIGRCFSATHDAHASCRSMAQTMAMGQAAGVAANISLEKNYSATNLPINFLQNELATLGNILEIPNNQAFIGKNDWHKN